MKKISIGKRNLKTALSVFIALCFYLIFILLDIITGYYDGGFSGFTGLYTPFFAAIAAAYTSHKDYKSSLKQAKIRSVGSIFGGYFGMIIIILAEGLVPFLFPDINYIIYLISIYAFVSLGIIFLIYIIVKFKQTDATFIACLTYLSVTVSIRNGGMPIGQFATNRIFSTLVGVGIALLINNIRIFYHKNHNVLFIANIDHDVDYHDYPLSFTRYKMNDLYQRGAKLLLHTAKSGVDENLFKDVHINQNLVLMNGVCIYDSESKNYIYSCDFEEHTRLILNEYFRCVGHDVFSYVIHDYRLAVHYDLIVNKSSKFYYLHERENNTYPFINSPVLDYHDVAMYEMVINEKEIDKLYIDLEQLNIMKYIFIKIYKIPNTCDVLVKIKPFESHRIEAIKNVPIYDDCRYKIAFLTRKVDLEIAKIADFKVCLENSSNEIKNACDYVIKSDQFNDVLKFFNKLFYAKNIDKKLLKYKNKK